MTIEERAAQRYELHDWMTKPTRDAVKFARKVFIEIATEQQEIDIQRAEEWLKGVFLEQYLNITCSGGYETHVFDDKFFSEFKQAMKGE